MGKRWTAIVWLLVFCMAWLPLDDAAYINAYGEAVEDHSTADALSDLPMVEGASVDAIVEEPVETQPVEDPLPPAESEEPKPTAIPTADPVQTDPPEKEAPPETAKPEDTENPAETSKPEGAKVPETQQPETATTAPAPSAEPSKPPARDDKASDTAMGSKPGTNISVDMPKPANTDGGAQAWLPLDIALSSDTVVVNQSVQIIVFANQELVKKALGQLRVMANGAAIGEDIQIAGDQTEMTWTPTASGTYSIEVLYIPKADLLEPYHGGYARINATVGSGALTMADCDVVYRDGSQYRYTGSPHLPAIDVYYASTMLQPNVDYTLAYGTNINAGIGTITLTGRGTYSGTAEHTFTIEKAMTVLEGAVVGGNLNAYISLRRLDFVGGIETKVAIPGAALQIEELGTVSAPVTDGSGNYVYTRSSLANITTVQYAGDANHGAASVLTLWGTGMDITAPDISIAHEAVSANHVKIRAELFHTVPVLGTNAVSLYINETLHETKQITSWGTVEFDWTAVPEGMHKVYVVFTGGAKHLTAQSAVEVIGNLNKNVLLTVAPATAGRIRLSAVISGSEAIPQGDVVFYRNGAPIGTAGLQPYLRIASMEVAADAQLYAYQAEYLGDTHYLPGISNMVTHTNDIATNIALEVVRNTDGSAILIATVTSNSPGAVPGGVVHFTGSGVPSGASAVVGSDGVARYTWNDVPFGQFSVQADFVSTDGNHTASSSAAQPVSNQFATVHLRTKSVPGGGFALALEVEGGKAALRMEQGDLHMPTGEVTFKEDGVVKEVVPLVDGKAERTGAIVPTKRIVATAIYSGDINYFPQEASVTLGEDPPATSVGKEKCSITVAATAGSGDGPATLTAKVTGSAGTWPSGNVDFLKDGELLGTIVLYRGEAIFSWVDAPEGSHTIYAEYEGDDVYQGGIAVTVFRKNGHISPMTPHMLRQNPQLVILRDRMDKMITLYDTATLPVHNGIMVVDAKANSDYYSYGFNFSHLRTLSSQEEDGMFEVIMPWMTLMIPFDLSTGMNDLADYVLDRDLRPRELEVRFEISRTPRQVSPEALLAPPDLGRMHMVIYEIHISLYTLEGKKLDYHATAFSAPLVARIPGLETSDWVGRYDKEKEQFVEMEMQIQEEEAVLLMEQCGMYAVSGAGSALTWRPE